MTSTTLPMSERAAPHERPAMPIRRRVAGFLLCGAMFGGFAMSASAAFATDEAMPEKPTLAELKASCHKEIANRLTTLGTLGTTLTAAKSVTASHRASLTTILATTKSGLEALKPAIDAGATVAAVRVPCRSIVFDHRVYVLRSPQVRFTLALDWVDVRVGQLNTQAAAFQKQINALKAAGKPMVAAQAALSRMRSSIGAAKTNAANKADALIALVPASFNANHKVVDPFELSVVRARAAERNAVYWAVRTRAEILRQK